MLCGQPRFPLRACGRPASAMEMGESRRQWHPWLLLGRPAYGAQLSCPSGPLLCCENTPMGRALPASGHFHMRSALQGTCRTGTRGPASCSSGVFLKLYRQAHVPQRMSPVAGHPAHSFPAFSLPFHRHLQGLLPQPWAGMLVSLCFTLQVLWEWRGLRDSAS